MKMYDIPQDVSAYLNVRLECGCGRTHYAPIKAVDIGAGALERLPDYVKKYGYEKPYILCDEVTYRVAAERCAELLKESGIESHTHILRHLGYDEATLGEIVIHTPQDCDLMIGCGTGQITDILRYASFKLKLPCFTVATGAPMDGFAASVGIMNVNNLKATMPAHSTEVIIGDTEILKNAPYRMTVAGFGDLIGKLNALNDWRLAAIVTGEHYCRRIDELIEKNVDDILAESGLIKERKSEVLGDVMRALILSGSTISLYGSSRAISGAEHHMSHYWETIGDQRGAQFAMHGEQVAVGTVLALMLGKALAEKEIDFDEAERKAAAYDEQAWRGEIRRAYGTAADAVIELEERAQKNAAAGRLKRIDTIRAHWEEIRGLLSALRSPDWLRGVLTEVGCPCCPKDIGVDEALLRDSFLYCKETRDRYTLYSLAWDLGVMEELSGKVIAELKEKGLV